MVALLRAIGAALCSWLNLLRTRSESPKHQLDADPNESALLETDAGTRSAVNGPDTVVPTTKNSDENPRSVTEESLDPDYAEEGQQERCKFVDPVCPAADEPARQNARGPRIQSRPPSVGPDVSRLSSTGRWEGTTRVDGESSNGAEGSDSNAVESRFPSSGEAQDAVTPSADSSTGAEADDSNRQTVQLASIREAEGAAKEDGGLRRGDADGSTTEVNQLPPIEKLAPATAEEASRTAGPETTDATDETRRDRPEPSPRAKREHERRNAPRYRAPSGDRSRRRRSPKLRASLQPPDSSPSQNRVAAIDVRVVFRRGGFCDVSLLPRRPPGLPGELVVVAERGDVTLSALQDHWYQEVAPNNIAELLHNGTIWRDPNTGQEWLLSGREVFVLAAGIAHRGFVSCPRLVLGRSHVVLCTSRQVRPVEDALRAAGCSNWTSFKEKDGAPTGWQVLRDVFPQEAVPQSGDADIFNILRPLPEIEVVLEGGIRLAYNTWLVDYPPQIHVYGDPDHTGTVLIDGQEATHSEHEGYTAPRWDEEGEHQISCSGTNSSYSLVRSKANWTFWPAHSLEIRNSRNAHDEYEVCGPLVRPVVAGGALERHQVVQVPATNSVLLGAVPGELSLTYPRPNLRGARCLGIPPFDPVWALPPQPLHCDKRANRILLVADVAAARSNPCSDRVTNRRDLVRWCQLILDASRKGLAVEPASPAADNSWREYKRLARALWRRLR